MERIIVVDDDTAVLEAIGMVLEGEGYATVLLSENGDRLDLAIKEERPGLIILDILLSGHDGRAICRGLKSQEGTRHIPVILISAHPEAKATAYDAGADDFMAKPFDIDELLDAVAHQLHRC